MTYFAIVLLFITLWCWKTSPTYKMQRQQKKAQRYQYRCDKKYARSHRA